MCLNDNPVAVLVGISKEEGVDMVLTFNDSINKEKFNGMMRRK